MAHPSSITINGAQKWWVKIIIIMAKKGRATSPTPGERKPRRGRKKTPSAKSRVVQCGCRTPNCARCPRRKPATVKNERKMAILHCHTSVSLSCCHLNGSGLFQWPPFPSLTHRLFMAEKCAHLVAAVSMICISTSNTNNSTSECYEGVSHFWLPAGAT